MRRASIDKINARYRGTSALAPSGLGVRTSVVRGVSPVAPVVGVSHVAPSVIGARTSVIGGPSIIGAPSVIGGPSVLAGRGSVIRQGTSVVGGPVYGSTLAYPYPASGVAGVSGTVGLRRSTVITPPVIEEVVHPAVYETVTTPGKVY